MYVLYVYICICKCVYTYALYVYIRIYICTHTHTYLHKTFFQESPEVLDALAFVAAIRGLRGAVGSAEVSAKKPTKKILGSRRRWEQDDAEESVGVKDEGGAGGGMQMGEEEKIVFGGGDVKEEEGYFNNAGDGYGEEGGDEALVAEEMVDSMWVMGLVSGGLMCAVVHGLMFALVIYGGPSLLQVEKSQLSAKEPYRHYSQKSPILYEKRGLHYLHKRPTFYPQMSIIRKRAVRDAWKCVVAAGAMCL